MRKAVFSFYNLRSGTFRWWDEFPMALTRRLAAEGIEHIPFFKAYTENSIIPAGQQRRAPVDGMASPRWIRRHIGPLVRPYEAVIFHTHSYDPPCHMWVETLGRRRRHWLMTEHHSWPEARYSALKRWMRLGLRRLGLMPERIYGVSGASLERVHALYGRWNNPRFVFEGTNLNRMEPERSPRPKPRRALFVGRLVELKGLWPLVEAFGLLRARGRDVTLTIVGDGDLRPQLERYIERHNLESVIELAGYHPSPWEFYARTDFQIIPTLGHEAFGIVSIEARAHGIPAIYSPRGGIPETQINSRTGLMLREVTAEEIADKVEQLTSDAKRYEQMRRAAPEGLQPYRLEVMIEAYVEEYLNIFGADGAL